MFDLERLVRKNILSLKPYSSARDEFSGSEGIFLDANENPFGTLNRYPDPHQLELKSVISEVKSVPADQIFIGNGSDEVIDLLFRIFCNPGADKALTFSPTYGMYQVSADINDIELIQLPLNAEFQIDFQTLKPWLTNENLKLIFVCSPNNPSGNIVHKIEDILVNFSGIVVVDEAYVDFHSAESWSQKLDQYPNLVVCQTLSKAWGLAAARVGIAYSNPKILTLLNKVKPPYNVSLINQNAAIEALGNVTEFKKNRIEILAQKDWLHAQLSELKSVIKIHPSDSNFLLVEVENADKTYGQLVDQKIITRNRNKVAAGCIRITVGSKTENEKLIQALQEISK